MREMHYEFTITNAQRKAHNSACIKMLLLSCHISKAILLAQLFFLKGSSSRLVPLIHKQGAGGQVTKAMILGSRR